MNQKIRRPSLDSVPDSDWKTLSQKRIFFGHQSVGFNIVDGIRNLVEKNPRISLNLIETDDPVDFERPVFAHARLGANLNPLSKTDAFTSLMRNRIGGRVDIAFFKFCYVDIEKGTGIQALFEDYRTRLRLLKAQYPDTVFVHVTVPLKTTRTTWKTWLKDITGKGDLYEFAGNIERNEYNEMIRKEYSAKEPIFDLAVIESTHEDGSRSSFHSGGRKYFSLVPEYTDDGGHLNERGRIVVAEQLLIFLANLK